MEQLHSVVETFLACFFAFLIFETKCGFCKGYSVCSVTMFGNFQNALIFRILAFFWSRFFHRITTALSCKNVFRMFFAFLIFDPK